MQAHMMTKPEKSYYFLFAGMARSYSPQRYMPTLVQERAMPANKAGFKASDFDVALGKPSRHLFFAHHL
jgi:hypothetical protein